MENTFLLVCITPRGPRWEMYGRKPLVALQSHCRPCCAGKRVVPEVGQELLLRHCPFWPHFRRARTALCFQERKGPTISFLEGLQVLAPLCMLPWAPHAYTRDGAGKARLASSDTQRWWPGGIHTQCNGPLHFQTAHFQLSLPTSLKAVDFTLQLKHWRLSNAQTNLFSFVVLLMVKEHNEQIGFGYAGFRGMVQGLLHLHSCLSLWCRNHANYTRAGAILLAI